MKYLRDNKIALFVAGELQAKDFGFSELWGKAISIVSLRIKLC